MIKIFFYPVLLLQSQLSLASPAQQQVSTNILQPENRSARVAFPVPGGVFTISKAAPPHATLQRMAKDLLLSS